MERWTTRCAGRTGSASRSYRRSYVLAAGAEIVAVTTDLTRQKFRDTNLLDRCHVVDDPRVLPTVVRHLISVHGQPPGG
jgi:hypothetical protein